MDNWEILHAYRRLAAAGKVEYTLCDVDGEELVPVLNPKNYDMPSLRCLVCKIVYHLGSEHIRRMASEVEALTS